MTNLLSSQPSFKSTHANFCIMLLFFNFMGSYFFFLLLNYQQILFERLPKCIQSTMMNSTSLLPSVSLHLRGELQTGNKIQVQSDKHLIKSTQIFVSMAPCSQELVVGILPFQLIPHRQWKKTSSKCQMKRLLGLHRQPLFANNWILRYDSWLLPRLNESFNNHLEEGKMPYLY